VQNILVWVFEPKLSSLRRGYSSGSSICIFVCSINRKGKVVIFLFNIIMANHLVKFYNLLRRWEGLCDDSLEVAAKVMEKMEVWKRPRS